MDVDLEILVMQYLDGSMPEAERALFQARLENDPEAQELLRKHEALDDLLRNHWPIPEMNWGLLSEQLSQSVSDEELPAKVYKIDFSRTARRLAIAACLFIAGAVSVRIYMSYRNALSHEQIARNDPQVTPTQAHVELAGLEPSAGPVVSDVSVGPPVDVAMGQSQVDLGDDVIYRPSRVIIASGAESAQDDAAQSPLD